MKLSIILPVYNVEPYIERCLNSLINQDIPVKDYEIIVVNDGSPDKSRDVVVNMQRITSNLILVDQENQGVSIARNNGLAKARGEYILFVDPDDYIKINSLKKAIEIIEQNNLEVLFMGYEIIDVNEKSIYKSNFNKLENNIYTGVEAYISSHQPHIWASDRTWAILFKRVFLRNFNLKYPADVPYLEDGLFIGKVLTVANRCSFFDRPFYYLKRRQGSATHSNVPKSLKAQNGFILGAKDINQFSQDQIKLTREQVGLINHVKAKYIISSVISAISSRNIKRIIVVKAKLAENKFETISLNGLISNKIYVKCYNISIWLFVIFYVVETRIQVLLKLLKVKG